MIGLAQSHLLELVPHVEDFVIRQKCHSLTREKLLIDKLSFHDNNRKLSDQRRPAYGMRYISLIDMLIRTLG